jgi:hypothetical protein
MHVGGRTKNGAGWTFFALSRTHNVQVESRHGQWGKQGYFTKVQDLAFLLKFSQKILHVYDSLKRDSILSRLHNGFGQLLLNSGAFG